MENVFRLKPKGLMLLLCAPLSCGSVWAEKMDDAVKAESAVWSQSVTQQAVTIKGVVTDTAGEPIIGVSVKVQGTAVGTITGLDGSFQLKASQGAVLEISYIGYATQRVTVGADATSLNIILQEDTKTLEEVVVTAMGIERKAKSLTYATQKVGGEELTRAKDPNLINSLQGKTAGLTITPNSSGAGGSSKILIRGNKSAQGNNQPLIVIDGMPMANNSSTQLNDGFGGRDGGDALSNLNPDDIASINVLKGASAAALYGSMAANGVVLITTKKGSAGTMRIDVSSNTTFEQALALPKLQSQYGAVVNADGSLSSTSWGDKIKDGQAPGANRLDEFFRTGSTFINSLSISGGSDKMQSYLSYANTRANGIMPTNDFIRHNFSLKETLSLLDGKLSVTGSMSYIKQKGHNRHEPGLYRNALVGLYTFPANGDFAYYKNNFAERDVALGYERQIWYRDVNQDESANPYWVLHRNPHKETRDRIMLSGTVRYNITGDLSVQGRLSYDKSADTYDRRLYAGTSTVHAGALGSYQYVTNTDEQLYGDLMANYNKTFGNYSLSAALGTSFTDVRATELGASPGGNMYIANFFSVVNGDKNGNTQSLTRSRLNSVFATAQLGYKEMIYVDLTARNDWSSTLNDPFFYPSVGLTALVNEMTTLPTFINLLKLRASYSIVGNAMPAYITNPLHSLTNKGTVNFNENAPFKEMQPEKMHSMEFGFDVSMFENRLEWDFTYYKTNNKNQYFKMQVPSGTGYKSNYFNAGNIQNSGFETTLSYTQPFNEDLRWKTSVNLSYNDNKIVEIDDRLSSVEIGSIEGYRIRLTEGGSYGDIYGKVLKRDEKGVIQVNDQNIPLLSDEEVKVGNVNSKWTLGWGNTLSYKDFQFYFLIDGRMGGNYIDATQGKLDAYGVTQATADARNNGGVDLGNGTKIPAKNFYELVGKKDNMGYEYVYSATNFRLRELSLGYTFRNLLGNSKNLNVSLVGRNLFFLYKDAPSDPEVSMSTLNGYSGSSFFSLPSTRSLGINIKATF